MPSHDPPAGRRCAVLGRPVAHSLSPVLHRAAYARLGLEWSYQAHHIYAPYSHWLDAIKPYFGK